jgi:hypothetical protein
MRAGHIILARPAPFSFFKFRDGEVVLEPSSGPRQGDYWRAKLEEAQRRYSADPNAETRATFAE